MVEAGVNARTILLTSALLGAALGLGITWTSFGHSPNRTLPLETKVPAPPTVDGETPRLEVDKYSHDFGNVELGSTIRHAFVVTNRGPGVLKLTPGTTTCSACTIAELDNSEVPPGESAEVTVEYRTSGPKPEFRQTATVLTNDPRRSRIELTISGKTTSKVEVLPRSMDYGNVPAGESAQTEAQLRCYLPGALRIVEHPFEDAKTAELFELRSEPLTAEEARREDAESGYTLVLSLKPGLPLGAFQQTIRLTLEIGTGGQRVEERLPIVGTIVGDLSIVGPGWRNDVLSLGTIDRSAGTTRKLTILVRGAARDQVEVEATQLDPPQVRVHVGERIPLNESVDQIPLEIEIPPGLSPAIRLGTEQGPYGEVVLGIKNHPSVKEIRLKLKFVIK